MTNKRMFALEVVDTDKFLDMPPSSQALFFHLGMRADDEGFVASPKKIAKIANCGDDDLRLLAVKGFIIPFESGVIVVTHWGRLNNTVKSDRFKPTVYTKEKARIESVNGVYQLKDPATFPECLQNGSRMVPEWRQSGALEENKIEEEKSISFNPDGLNQSDSEGKTSSEAVNKPPGKTFDEQTAEDFEKIYVLYPRKQGKTKALRYYRQWMKGRKINGKSIRLDRKQVYLAVARYAEEQDGKDQQFVKMASTFFNMDIIDYLPPEEEDH